MTKSNTERKSNVIWKLFSSVKLTIALLILLAVVSVLGTLIPQHESAMRFARSLNPQLLRLFSFLNLFDMYHSLWFRFLMGCLGFNLIVCSIDRFRGVWKRFCLLPSPERSKLFEDLPPKQSLTVQGDPENTADVLARFLRTRYKRTNKRKRVDNHFFYGEKGRYSHFGVYVVHLSVLIILIGALVGSFFGFEAYVNIPEGEQVDTVTLRKGMSPLSLGFEVRCEKFTVDFYENGTPKEFRSELTFVVNGKKEKMRSLLVNHPVQFKGVTFYQASYGTLPGKKVTLKISKHASDQEITTVEVEAGKSFQLPGNSDRLQVVEVKGNFMGMGPAARISIQPDQGGPTRFWVFQNQEAIRKRFPGLMDRFPKLNPSAFSPYTFFVDLPLSRYYTGLQVNKDPGVPIVWVGCFLMITGFFVTFFTSHRRIWVRLSKERGEIKISVAGTASKNPVGLQRELEHLTNSLKSLFSEKR